ncbi:isochorismate synthase MenF [uncultured Microbacterium sp.]|uniref:isochorismate synthase n=1 Tax=uncultured Microbacterium sp. TaxID=191216 RepID=UPI00261E8A8D|nr:chorismate-binding protein [uncultured Microbacterium sp.]
MPATHPVPRLVAVTREIEPRELIALADPRDPLLWLRRGDGMVAAGAERVAEIRVSSTGESRAARLADDWRALAAAATVDDTVGLAGTGLVGFGVSTFAEDSPADAVIAVPRTIVGRRGDRAWITNVRHADEAPSPEPTTIPEGASWSATLSEGAMDAARYQHAVASIVRRIERGEVSKAVLARDLRGVVPAGADLRRLVRALVESYPDTWVYAVDGMIGASPETLVTASAGTVTARVLAGTVARGSDPDRDAAAAVSLAASAKDTSEHRYAVRSVLDALRPLTSSLAAAEHPFTLGLANVWHLATDVSGSLSHGSSVLDLVAALHPTAAVGGTPTAEALRVIADEEAADRGRYAAPVGWIDHNGDGEWAIALRGAQFGVASPGASTRTVVAHAGAGIVAASDPEAELLETRAKFRPILDALG